MGDRVRPSPESAPAAEAVKPAGGASSAAPAGELRGRVLEYVRGRPREELGPTAVARAVNASSGAVSNAPERLVETGESVRKAESRRRFAAALKR